VTVSRSVRFRRAAEPTLIRAGGGDAFVVVSCVCVVDCVDVEVDAVVVEVVPVVVVSVDVDAVVDVAVLVLVLDVVVVLVVEVMDVVEVVDVVSVVLDEDELVVAAAVTSNEPCIVAE
jgi:hypothetical protein